MKAGLNGISSFGFSRTLHAAFHSDGAPVSGVEGGSFLPQPHSICHWFPADGRSVEVIRGQASADEQMGFKLSVGPAGLVSVLWTQGNGACCVGQCAGEDSGLKRSWYLGATPCVVRMAPSQTLTVRRWALGSLCRLLTSGFPTCTRRTSSCRHFVGVHCMHPLKLSMEGLTEGQR